MAQLNLSPLVSQTCRVTYAMKPSASRSAARVHWAMLTAAMLPAPLVLVALGVALVGAGLGTGAGGEGPSMSTPIAGLGAGLELLAWA